MPHEAYMEEPVGVVEWMLRLDNLRLEVEHEWQAQ